MNSIYQIYYDYLENSVLSSFYQWRLNKLNELTLKGILERKNPYLFKAKNLEVAGDLVKGVVDAYLSSQEETKFGDYLEAFAIFVSHNVDGGFKSKGLKSIDLEFQRDNIYYIVGIKSGIKWGNSDQISAMKNNFKIAKEILRTNGVAKDTENIIAVNGCIYGKDSKPFKNDLGDAEKSYYKYAGQDFWNFISHDDNLYQEIIVPIDKEAKTKDAAFKLAYTSKVNEMTTDFLNTFMTSSHEIDWVKLIDFVSKRKSDKR